MNRLKLYRKMKSLSQASGLLQEVLSLFFESALRYIDVMRIPLTTARGRKQEVKSCSYGSQYFSFNVCIKVSRMALLFCKVYPCENPAVTKSPEGYTIKNADQLRPAL